MDPVALWVTVGGVALAAAVNVYFFMPKKAVAARSVPVMPPASVMPPAAGLSPSPAATPGTVAAMAPARPPASPAPEVPLQPAAVHMAPVETVQEAHILVLGGYQPSIIEVGVGRPVRLVFRREETEGCSDTVIFPEWGIFQHLPAHEDTVVEFTPEQTGEFEFTCGMQMLRGTIVVS